MILNPELVSSSDARIVPLERLIVPLPERVEPGQHILFCDDSGEAYGYLQVIPCFWIGGEIKVLEQSHWCYMARIAFKRPYNLHLAFRKYAAKSWCPFLYPLTLISKPANKNAMRQHLKLGFTVDKWLNGFVTFHSQNQKADFFAKR